MLSAFGMGLKFGTQTVLCHGDKDFGIVRPHVMCLLGNAKSGFIQENRMMDDSLSTEVLLSQVRKKFYQELQSQRGFVRNLSRN